MTDMTYEECQNKLKQIEYEEKIELAKINKERRIRLRRKYTDEIRIDFLGKSDTLYIYHARNDEIIAEVHYNELVIENGGYINEYIRYGRGSTFNINKYIKNKKYKNISQGICGNVNICSIKGGIGEKFNFKKHKQYENQNNNKGITNHDIIIFEIGGRNDKNAIVKGTLIIKTLPDYKSNI